MFGPVAQWIEQFRPKEEVVRSTRTRVTRKQKKPFKAYFVFCYSGGGANYGSPAVGDEYKSKINFRFIEATPGEKSSRSEDLLAPGLPFFCYGIFRILVGFRLHRERRTLLFVLLKFDLLYFIYGSGGF